MRLETNFNASALPAQLSAFVEPELLGSIGPLAVRLASSEAEIQAAQSVRHHVFIEEMGARGTVVGNLEADAFDTFCDHLIVIDRSLPGPDARRVVGTYRLLRQDQAARNGGFYSDGEYNLRALIARRPGERFLELGRSCVLPAYRSKRTIEVLWQGIWSYVKHHAVDVMVGCASFPGTVPARHAQALSYLAHHCRAEAGWDVSALPRRYQPMDLMPVEAVDARAAIASMPPLMKGYLRVGARFGDGCVIDHDFGTVDVFVIMPVNAIGARYVSYYGRDARQAA